MNSIISTFVTLGKQLGVYAREEDSTSDFNALLTKVYHSNGWFEPLQVKKALLSWSNSLQKENIQHWLQKDYFTRTQSQTIGLIVAGNIPFVGLHDLLCIWASPHKGLVKCASKDPYLLPWVVSLLEDLDPENKGKITFIQGPLKGFDAVIATGSNNSARYFESYFNVVPNLIRKNRNAVAVLDGSESTAQLEALGDDILRYYGLGCRNVSKVYLPKDYDLDQLFGGLYPKRDSIENSKYANNYDYNKAVYLMSDFEFLENGFFLLRESSEWAAPIACLNYQYYSSLEDVKKEIADHTENIQCVVSELDLPHSFPLGKAQEPQLWDYADGQNTLEFLGSI